MLRIPKGVRKWGKVEEKIEYSKSIYFFDKCTPSPKEKNFDLLIYKQ